MQIYACNDCYMEMMYDAERMCLTCSNCASHYVYSVPQCKIVKIGIEMEGGWEELPDQEYELGRAHRFSFHDDRSVSTDYGGDECGDCSYCVDGEGDHCYNNDGLSGELVSEPMDAHEVNWEEWVKRFYPHDVNSTCGGHFHVSFDNKQAYEILCTEVFFNYFLTELRAWGKRANIRNQNFWDRLDGENSMCTTNFRGHRQLYIKGDNYPDCRYSALNFQYHKHGTMEIRILPMFLQPNVYIKAVKVSMGIIQKYLDSVANRPIPVETRTIEPEFDFEGRITNTTVMEYINNEEPEISEEITVTNEHEQVRVGTTADDYLSSFASRELSQS